MSAAQPANRRFSSFSAIATAVAYVALGVVILLNLTVAPAWSQATSSNSVSGSVTDPSGAAIPDAEIRMLDASTNQTLTAKTNAAGRYIFINVPSATYSVSITREGFNTHHVDKVQVEIGSAVTLNATLAIGSTSTVVEVVGTAIVDLQTSNATVGTSMSGDTLQNMPNMGRDVSTLAVLQPGTTLGGFTAGAFNDQNTYQIDGGNATDDMAGNTTGYQTNFTGLGGTQTSGTPSGVVPTPVESVEEFKVSGFNQTADFNNSIGGQIQMATKRGSNQYHGSAYGFYFATNVGAANTWANNHTPSAAFGLPYTPLPSNHRDRFGASLGGVIAPKFLGGKTYAFFNYEGLRFPNVGTYERTVPTDLMRLGVIQLPDASGAYQPYNLNPFAVDYQGKTYQPASCGAALCDPRGIGLNPVVNQIWSKYMPHANDFQYGGTGSDNKNTAGYLSTIRAPLTSDVYIARIDHDFSEKWRFMSSYRYMRLINLTTNQVDIGGFFGGTLGQPVATAPRPQLPSFFVAGLTTNITPTLTSDFRFSYLRSFWQWGDQNAPPQLAGLGGAVEIAPGTSSGAESATALIPYNVNTQSIRQRFWDGQDSMFKDDLSWAKGKHLFQFGGSFQHNFDYHSRTDNGVGTNNQIVYQLTNSNINFTGSPYIPSTVPSAYASQYATLYSEALGLVGLSQVAYTRAGNALNLQPLGSSAFDKSKINYYQGYFGDTWRMTPSFTLAYSLGYALEMPPVEESGKQVMVVDGNNVPINVADFVAQRKAAALQGKVYLPQVGFSLVGNTANGGRTYPYDPFYKEWSPRVSGAWNPRYQSGLLGKIFGDGQTVLRGGYSLIWGRVNGVTQVLSPLLGVGLIQAVACQAPTKAGVCGGVNGSDPTTAFRIGVDGNSAPLPAAAATLPQPFFPGLNGNAPASDTSVLDPNYRPEKTNNFTFSIQRQLSGRTMLEVGVMMRSITNELLATNLDGVPYMTTLGGQTFAAAYSALAVPFQLTGVGALSAAQAAGTVTPQPFFEAALGGAGSATCKGFSSCTAMVATTYFTQLKNSQVSDIWAALNRAASWTLGRTMISGAPTQAASIEVSNSRGWGNYNAMYVTWRARDFHHATIISNFTWGRSLGTATAAQYNSSYTQLDMFNSQANYGVNSFDYKLLYNLAINYQTPWYSSQKGVLGHIVGGWKIAPLFFAQSGAPLGYFNFNNVSYAEGSGSQYQSFGQSNSTSIATYAQNAVAWTPYTAGNSAHYGVAGSNAVGTNNPTGINLFADPAAALAGFRRCILGFDTSCGASGNIRSLPTWNMDASVTKDIGVWKERVGAALSFQFTNVLNHFQPSNPSSLSLSSPSTFGRITGQSNTPRNMEFGLRIHF